LFGDIVLGGFRREVSGNGGSGELFNGTDAVVVGGQRNAEGRVKVREVVRVP